MEPHDSVSDSESDSEWTSGVQIEIDVAEDAFLDWMKQGSIADWPGKTAATRGVNNAPSVTSTTVDTDTGTSEKEWKPVTGSTTDPWQALVSEPFSNTQTADSIKTEADTETDTDTLQNIKREPVDQSVTLTDTCTSQPQSDPPQQQLADRHIKREPVDYIESSTADHIELSMHVKREAVDHIKSSSSIYTKHDHMIESLTIDHNESSTYLKHETERHSAWKSSNTAECRPANVPAHLSQIKNEAGTCVCHKTDTPVQTQPADDRKIQPANGTQSKPANDFTLTKTYSYSNTAVTKTCTVVKLEADPCTEVEEGWPPQPVQGQLTVTQDSSWHTAQSWGKPSASSSTAHGDQTEAAVHREKEPSVPSVFSGPDTSCGGRHEETHQNHAVTDHVCDVCSETFTKAYYLRKHRKLHSGSNMFVCHICNNAFSCASDLNKHKITHTDRRAFVCDVCSKAFTRAGHLNRHKRIHTGHKPFLCEVCSKGFTQAEDLREHMRIHTGHKPYICDVCTKAFTQSAHLKTHMMSHTGQQPKFICDVCNEAFTRSNSLRVHMRIHTGDKPFICDVCSKAFTRSGTLKRHMRIHTGVKPFVCDVCSKAFTRPGTMKAHKRVHTGQKPFACDVCGKRFTQLWNLKSHMPIHNGGKSFICNVCSKAFKRSGDLKRHACC